jgi:hypothetical protein
MTTTDPTNARLRDFDIPVIMPRFDLIDVPNFDEAVFTGDLDPASSTGKPGHPGRDGGSH